MEKQEEFSNDWSTSPIMNLSPKAQAGIVGTFIGVPTLAAIDALLSLDAWLILPEAAGIAALLFGATYVMKRRGINLKEAVSDLNWGALLGDQATPETPSEAQEVVLPQETAQRDDSDDDYINIGPMLRPHANAILSNRLVVLGIPGAGKSNIIAVLAEEIAQIGAPLLLLDTENEYKPLCAKPYFKRPFVADSSNVNLEIAFSFGQRIMDERLQVVLNLDSFDDDDTAALVMIDIIKGIQTWEEALSNDDRIPCAIILEEAAVWLPQNAGESMLSKVKDENDLTILDKLQKIFFSVVVRRGRKRGMGFILASQRSAEIDKRAISSAQWKILKEQNQPSDLKVYREFGVPSGVAQALTPDQAFVLGPGGIKEVYQLRMRYSPDNAKTPGLESLRKRRYTESLAARAAQMAEVPVTPSVEPVRAMQRPVEQPKPSHFPSPKMHPNLEKALELYNQGYTSARTLAVPMHVGKDTANGYIQQLKARKLIV